MNTELSVSQTSQQFSGQMLRYEAAVLALAEAFDVDEVREFDNRAEAVRAYAKQAQNLELEMQATEIRLRARRRMGQLLDAIIAETKPPLSKTKQKKVFLEKFGISMPLTVVALSAASPSDEQYERLMEGWRGRCLKASRTSLTLEPPPAPQAPVPPTPDEPREPCVFDDWYAGPEGFRCAGELLGDVHAEYLDEYIVSLLEDAEESAAEFDRYVKLFRALRKHFGSEVQQSGYGPVPIRNIIKPSRLALFMLDAGFDLSTETDA